MLADGRMIRDDRVDARAGPAESTDNAADGQTIDHGGYAAAAHAFQSKLASGTAGRREGDDGGSRPAEVPAALLDFDDADLDWS